MSQARVLVRLGFENVRDNGAMVITSGVLARSPMQGRARCKRRAAFESMP